MESVRKVALITGASRGIGAETALTLAKRGMRVVINYFSSQERANELVRTIESDGGEAMAIAADVRDESQITRMVDEVISKWGAIDVLVNNALIPFPIQSFAEMEWGQFEQKLVDEMKSAFMIVKSVIPHMEQKRYGRIVFVSTNLSKQPRPGMIAVGVSKAALNQFARYIAQEYGPKGITANIVAPGTVDTDNSSVLPDELIKRMESVTPLGRIAKPNDVAKVIAFFASDDSEFMTGDYIPVNGGLSM